MIFVPDEVALRPLSTDEASLALALRLRFRLTIREPAVPVYDVIVRRECYEMVGVGDTWPSTHTECR